MEVPDLGSSAIWSLDDHVSVVDQVEVSVVWERWDNVEVSLNIKTESFVELTLSWFTLPFVNVDNIPLLMDLVVSLVDTDVSVFLINSTLNFHYLSSLVDNLRSLVSEELPPSWVGSGTSDIGRSSISLNVKWVALPVVILDGLGDLIEVPLLSSNISSPSLQPNIVGTVALNDSLEWQSWSDVEWSVDVKTEFFIDSLGSILCLGIQIENLPSLVGSVVSTMNLNSLHFFILSLEYIKASVGFLDIAEVLTLEYEDLPPSWVGAPDLHVLCLSWALDIPWLVIQSSSDSQGLLVEVPNLGSSTVWNLNDHVSVVNQVKVSVIW
jgi:hypothetical protein